MMDESAGLFYLIYQRDEAFRKKQAAQARLGPDPSEEDKTRYDALKAAYQQANIACTARINVLQARWDKSFPLGPSAKRKPRLM